MDPQHDLQRIGPSPPSSHGVEGPDTGLKILPGNQTVHRSRNISRLVLRFLPSYSRSATLAGPYNLIPTQYQVSYAYYAIIADLFRVSLAFGDVQNSGSIDALSVVEGL